MSDNTIVPVKNLGVVVNAQTSDGTMLPVKFSPVLNKSGRATKLVAALAPVSPAEGDGSARALKAYFKAQNPDAKPATIRELVQKSLRNSETVRIVAAQALFTALVKAGNLPDTASMNLKGTETNLRFTAAGVEKPTSAEKKISKAQAERDALAKEVATLKEQLAKLLAAAGAAPAEPVTVATEAAAAE